MNIKMLNAYLKLLGPAPKGMKWKMAKVGETFKEGMKAVDVKEELGGSGEWISGIHDNDIGKVNRGGIGQVFPHMRYWGLVPHVPKKPKKPEVRIEVSGGVAWVASRPKNVRVVIYDHDNAKDTPEGEKYEPDIEE